MSENIGLFDYRMRRDGFTDLLDAWDLDLVEVEFQRYHILFAGQSNILAYLLASNLGIGLEIPYPAVWYNDHNSGASSPPSFIDDGPRPLAPRTKVVASLPIGTGSFELQIGRRLNAVLPNQLVFSKMGYDSSGLENQWWNPAFPVGGPPLYDQFISYGNARAAATNSRNVGVVWCQANRDANESPDFQNYGTHIEDFYAYMRAAWGADFWMVFDQLHSSASGGGNAFVRTQQAAFAAAHPDTVRMRDPSALTLRDTAHYDDPSVLALSDWFADDIIDLMGITVPPAPTPGGATRRAQARGWRGWSGRFGNP